MNPPKYRADIDGLRALAVWAVVAFHAFPTLVQGGFIGVDIFFVISGFLISSVLFENMQNGTFNAREFYSRRIKRIFPALLTMLISVYIVGGLTLFADEYQQLGKHIAAGAGFISNFILFNDIGYFDTSAELKPLLHLWSLGIEEQFYILWPLLLWLCRKNRLHFLIAIVIIGGTSFYLNISEIKENPAQAFYFPQTRFWELIAGGLIAWMNLHTPHLLLRNQRVSNLASIFGLFLLLWGFYKINANTPFPGIRALLPVLGTTLLISAPAAWLNRNLFSNPIAVGFGLISYPFYLWHWPLLSFARIIEGDRLSAPLRLGLVIFSILLAFFTYQFIEKPIRRSSKGSFKTLGLCALSLVLLLIGYLTFIYEGLPQRASIKNYSYKKNEAIRLPATHPECLEYIGVKKNDFHYCRFANAHSAETVALIGDSHAYIAFPGVAEVLTQKKINTLVLAASHCPPLLGVNAGFTDAAAKDCARSTEQLLQTVTSNTAIHKVFFIMRGPLYFTDQEPLTGNEPLKVGHLNLKQLKSGIQSTIDKITSSGKTVYFLLENPELKLNASSCLGRPWRPLPKECQMDRDSVLLRQKDYVAMAKELKKVTLIESIDAFCPVTKCLIFNTADELLYGDDDHLSSAGSRFQAQKLLLKHLTSEK